MEINYLHSRTVVCICLIVLFALLRIWAGVKKAIIESAETVILLATDDKFYNSSLFEFCDASQIDIIITNHPSPPPHILRII